MILAVIVGVPLLSRLRGDYFSFGTLGMGMIISVIFLNGGKLTGGSEGKLLIKVMPEGVDVQLAHSTTMPVSCVAIFATVVVYFMTNSRIGLALKAIREDEVSAASHGVNVLKYKVIAFAVAAGLAGLAGQRLHLLPPASHAHERVRADLAVPAHPHGGARAARARSSVPGSGRSSSTSSPGTGTSSSPAGTRSSWASSSSW